MSNFKHDVSHQVTGNVMTVDEMLQPNPFVIELFSTNKVNGENP